MGIPWDSFNRLKRSRGGKYHLEKSKLMIIHPLLTMSLISAIMFSAVIFLNTTNSDSSTKIGKIVFDRQKDSNNDIWVMYSDGSGQKRLTTHYEVDWDPVWSPDGMKIAFVSDRSGSNDIWVMDYNGNNKVQLTTDPSYDWYPDWSPDGKRIVFASKRAGNWDIWVMNSDGTNQTQLTTDPSKEWYPTWSPNGNKIAFSSFISGGGDIWVMNTNGSEQIRLTTDPSYDASPAWSPDGKKIAFRSTRAGNEDIWVMDFDGTNQTQLTTNPSYDSAPAWSPDGKKILFDSRRSGYNNIWVMNSDGSNKIQLTTDDGGDRLPNWGLVPAIPDLIIGNISFNIPTPIVCGTSLKINATIYNVGDGNASNVHVKFYDNEIKPENQIGNNQRVSFIERFSGIGFAEVQWTATSIGIHYIFVVVDPDDNITESNETNNILFKVINVIDILPPELYIKAIGNDIILNWTPQKIIGLSHYLLYRSTSQTEFDFSRIWNNTSQHNDNGIIPLRTTWNDTGAASISAPQEYYYTIRSVLNTGEISSTSRTVGKWTKTFPKGISTFSLPLEPIELLDTDFYTTKMNAKYIRYMNTITRKWMTYNFGDGNTNNTQMIVGEGYEVKFDSQTNYTFTGIPGAILSYDDNNSFSGFDHATEAKSLTVSVEPNGNVTLTWEEPASMNSGDWYEVYYSNTRDGFFGTFNVSYFPVCPPVYFGNNTTTHNGALANNPGTRLYYMVVPYNASGIRGSSTYSIGIWTEEYLSQYDTVGIPLKLNSFDTADGFCNKILDAVGINYYNNSNQRWCWHSTRMPSGAYDPILEMTEGYQISTSNTTKFTFIGI